MTSTTTSPIGSLMRDAEKRAEMKTSHTHTSTAPCGCSVTVNWISKGCHLLSTDRCEIHAFARGKK